MNHHRPATACPTNLPHRPNPPEKSRLLPASPYPWGLLAFLKFPASASVCSPSSAFPGSFGSTSCLWLISGCSSLSSFHQCFTLTLRGPCILSPSQILEASLELSMTKSVFYSPILCISKKKIQYFPLLHIHYSLLPILRICFPHQQVSSF